MLTHFYKNSRIVSSRLIACVSNINNKLNLEKKMMNCENECRNTRQASTANNNITANNVKAVTTKNAVAVALKLISA